MASAAQRKQSGVEDANALGEQPLTGRTPWYGEGSGKTAPLPPWQAERAALRGPKASVIKAGWPRLGVRREGATREPEDGAPGRTLHTTARSPLTPDSSCTKNARHLVT